MSTATVLLISALPADETYLADALAACGVAPTRWPSFEKAIADLLAAEIIRER